MAPKQLCLSGLNIQSIELKAHIGEKDESILSKLRETMIRKSREYCTLFPKYRGISKQGQAWCGNICYYTIDYKVETIAAEDTKFTIYKVETIAAEDTKFTIYKMETIAAEDTKFTIYGAIQNNLITRVLHLEPGTIGFNSFTLAEYMEKMLGRFMNARTKVGAKKEFEHENQWGE